MSTRFYEMIFCEGSLSFKEIISRLGRLPANTQVKIHASNSRSIVGSKSKDDAGESVSKENGFRLADPYYRRLKRLVDITVSIFGILLFPVHLFVVRKPFSFLANSFKVLAGGNTWIGYAADEKQLPQLRKGIIACNSIPVSEKQQLPAESLHMLDYWYARDYQPRHDWKILRNVYRKLGG